MLKAKELNGKIIAVDGCDLHGKTTLIDTLAKRLSENYEVEVVSFPGNSEYGKLLRADFKEGLLPNNLRTATLMFANFAEVYYRVIRPAVNAGKVVLIDRYVASTLAYQGQESRATRLDIMELVANAMPFVPDYQVYITFDKEVLAHRQEELLVSGREVMDMDLMSTHVAEKISLGYERVIRYWSTHGYSAMSPKCAPSNFRLIRLYPDQSTDLNVAIVENFLQSTFGRGE